MGFPLVLKVLSAEILHKSDVDGVVLGLRSEDEVREALEARRELGEGWLLEPQLPPPLAEMILSLHLDPQFGPCLLLGSGGIWVDLFQDSQNLLLPVSEQDILTALTKLKIYPLLQGYRGKAKADMTQLLKAIMALNTLAQEMPQLLEIEINPLFIYPDSVVAVDAVMRLAKV
ncbi:MAG: acetate--CoA ligase family protein [Deinococcales bacterium]